VIRIRLYHVRGLLIGKGANLSHINNKKQTPMHYAASKNHIEVVKKLS